MAKELIKIGIAFEYDPEENRGIPARIFLFQMLNRLNYEYPITSIRFKGREKTFDKTTQVRDLELKERDTIEGVPFVE
jgi:hypothetical protein